MRFALIALLLLVFVPLVAAAPTDFVPTGNISGRGRFTLYNFTNVSAGRFCFTPSDCITSWPSGGSGATNVTVSNPDGYTNLSSNGTNIAGRVNLGAFDLRYPLLLVFQSFRDDTYSNTTALQTSNASTNARIDALNLSKLNASDQRYNDTTAITALAGNTTALQTSNASTNARIDTLNSTKLNTSDQRYNDSAAIASLSTFAQTKAATGTVTCTAGNVLQNITIGNASVTGQCIPDATGGGGGGGSGNVTSSNLSAGYVPRATNTTNLATGSIFDNGTGIGIGTTNVSQTLMVGAQNGSGTIGLGWGGAVIGHFNTGNQLVLLASSRQSAGNREFVHLGIGNCASGYGSTMCPFAYSEIGNQLVLNAPWDNLDGYAEPGTLRVGAHNPGDVSRAITISNAAGGDGSASSIGFSVRDSASVMSTVSQLISNATSVTSGATSSDIQLFTSNAGAMQERVRIKNNGFVGINTTAPTQTLDVRGNINTSGILYTPQVCLAGDCRTSWSTGSGGAGNMSVWQLTNGSATGNVFNNSVVSILGSSSISSTFASPDDITIAVRTGGIGATELASTTVVAGTYGNNSTTVQFTVDADGRITSATTRDISITSSQIADASAGLINRSMLNTTNTGASGQVLGWATNGQLVWQDAASGGSGITGSFASGNIPRASNGSHLVSSLLFQDVDTILVGNETRDTGYDAETDLEISETTGIAAVTINQNTATLNSELRFRSGTNDAIIRLNGTSLNAFELQFESDSLANITETGNVNIIGNYTGRGVGINTTTLTQPLDVRGNANISGVLYTPQLCLNNDCRTAWPSGGGGGGSGNVTATETAVGALAMFTNQTNVNASPVSYSGGVLSMDVAQIVISRLNVGLFFGDSSGANIFITSSGRMRFDGNNSPLEITRVPEIYFTDTAINPQFECFRSNNCTYRFLNEEANGQAWVEIGNQGDGKLGVNNTPTADSQALTVVGNANVTGNTFVNNLCMVPGRGNLQQCQNYTTDPYGSRRTFNVVHDPMIPGSTTSGSIGMLGWASTFTGTGAALSAAFAGYSDNVMGGYNLTSGTVNFTNATLSTSTSASTGWWVNGSTGITGWYSRVAMSNTGSGTAGATQYQFMVGFSDSTNNVTATDGALAMYNTTNNAWALVTCAAGTCSTNISSFRTDNRTFVDLDVQMLNNTLVVLYVNGQLAATSSQNIPSGSGQVFWPGAIRVRNTGTTTTTATGLMIDYYGFYREFWRARW